MKFWFLWLVVTCSLLACQKDGGTKPKDPGPVFRAKPGKELCEEACQVMTEKLIGPDGGVGCEEALPTPVTQGKGDVACDGGLPLSCISCVALCRASHDYGAYWNNECILKAILRCDEIETVCNTQ